MAETPEKEDQMDDVFDGPLVDGSEDEAEIEIVEKDDEPVDATDADEETEIVAEDEVSAKPEEDADEDAKFSQQTRERIQRERSVTARERSERIAAQLDAVDARKQLAQVLDMRIDSEIDETKKELVRAKEEGETSKEVDLQEKLAELRSKKQQMSGAKIELENSEKLIKEQSARVNSGGSVSGHAQRWMDKNKWFSHKSFRAEAALALQIDNKLAGEGLLDKNSSEYFLELDNRLREEIPDIRQRVRKVFKPTEAIRSNAAPVGRSGGAMNSASGAEQKKRFVLTAAHQSRMRDIKMDPKNSEHVKQFARSVMGLN